MCNDCYEENKKNLEAKVLETVAKIKNNSDVKKVIPMSPNRTSQYEGIIYWVRLELTEKAIAKLKDEYKEATAIHIMPFRITEEDIRKSVEKDSVQPNFKGQPIGFVDYDPTTGNFHKKNTC